MSWKLGGCRVSSSFSKFEPGHAEWCVHKGQILNCGQILNFGHAAVRLHRESASHPSTREDGIPETMVIQQLTEVPCTEQIAHARIGHTSLPH